MKKQSRITGLTGTLIAVMLMQASAADYSWTGGGANNNLSNAGNWGGSAPTSANPALFFTGEGATVNNDLGNPKQLTGFTFYSDAGAFTFQGGAFSLYNGADITNLSTSTQTFNTALSIAFGNRSIDTAVGNIISNAGIGQIGGTYSLTKKGTGTLTMRGSNTYAGTTQILGGTIVLDYSAGSTFATSGYQLGSVTVYALGNSTKLQAIGAPTVSLPSVTIANHAANKITIGSNVSATTANLTKNGLGALNVNLSASGSNLAITSPPSLTNGILSYATVTDSTGTSLATINAGAMQKFTPASALPTTSGGTFTQNYSTSGNISVADGSGYANIYSLTITGGGSLAANNVQLSSLLMQESATTDYVVNARLGYSQPLYIHQYSTSGALVVNGQLLATDASVGFSKTGPGTMRITGSSSSSYAGSTYLQSGSLDVDGQLTKTASVIVYADARLYGGGSIGVVAPTALTIRDGGILAASSSEALDIIGSIQLESHSTFEFTIDGIGSDFLAATDDVNLNSANLSLLLTVSPTLLAKQTLLSGGSLSGTFSSINGQAFSADNIFRMSFEGVEYNYQLSYNPDNTVSVQALSVVPEPSTWALIGLGTLTLLLRRKRS